MTFVRKSNQSSQPQGELHVLLQDSMVVRSSEVSKQPGTFVPTLSQESLRQIQIKNGGSSNSRGRNSHPRKNVENDTYMLPLLKHLTEGGRISTYAQLNEVDVNFLGKNFNNWMKRKHNASGVAQMVAVAFRKGLLK